MLVSIFELLKPLYDMLLDHKQSVEHLDRGHRQILSPFHYVGRVDDDPIVFMRQHSRVV